MPISEPRDVTEPRILPMPDPRRDTTIRTRPRRLFVVGLFVRLVGLGLIWAGDGSAAWWRKALVVLGVALSIGGIAVLRYLLLAGPLSRLGARWRARVDAAADARGV
jgi:hypothetical protein